MRVCCVACTEGSRQLILCLVRPMRVLVIVILTLVAAAADARELFEHYSVYGRANGRSYTFTAAKSALAKTPVWDPQSEHPPLPPRRAEQIARRQLRQFVPNGNDWLLQGVTLSPVGDDLHWVYTVTFMAPLPEGVAQTGGDEMQLLVLLDGSVVKPEISPIAR